MGKITTTSFIFLGRRGIPATLHRRGLSTTLNERSFSRRLRITSSVTPDDAAPVSACPTVIAIWKAMCEFSGSFTQGFQNHAPSIFMNMHPPFSQSFTHRFHDHAPTLAIQFLAVCFLLGNHQGPPRSVDGGARALPHERTGARTEAIDGQPGF